MNGACSCSPMGVIVVLPPVPPVESVDARLARERANSEWLARLQRILDEAAAALSPMTDPSRVATTTHTEAR